MNEPLIKWDSKISPKDILSWAAMAVGLIIIFADTRNSVEVNKSSISALMKRADDSDARDRAQDERFNNLNTNFTEMKGDIKVIRFMLESRRPSEPRNP